MIKFPSLVISVVLLTACAIPSQPVNVDRSMLQDIPPEAALAWLQQVSVKKVGLIPICQWTRDGVQFEAEVVPWPSMKINAVQRVASGYGINSGVIGIVLKENAALTTAFTTNGRCVAYRDEYPGAQNAERNERMRVDMNKTLSALGALGVDLGELPE